MHKWDAPTQLRPKKSLNNIIEQDHRTVKKISRASLGYKSFHTASKTIKGIEILHIINKGQVTGVNRRSIVAQKQFIEGLFEVAA